MGCGRWVDYLLFHDNQSILNMIHLRSMLAICWVWLATEVFIISAITFMAIFRWIFIFWFYGLPFWILMLLWWELPPLKPGILDLPKACIFLSIIMAMSWASLRLAGSFSLNWYLISPLKASILQIRIKAYEVLMYLWIFEIRYLNIFLNSSNVSFSSFHSMEGC